MTRFWENVTQFSACWTRFEDKVGRTLGRTHQPCHDLANRDTILTVSVYYLSVCLQILKVWLLKEKLDNTKEVTLGLSVFVGGSLVLGNIVITLESENH